MNRHLLLVSTSSTFGTGFLDLPKLVAVLRRRGRPGLHFCLEMITRDPLRVPVLTERYWATFPSLPGVHLARTLALVQRHAAKEPLPHVKGLSPAEQQKREDDNVVKSLAHARTHLGL